MLSKINRLPSSGHEAKSARASVSFPRDLYDTLERLAKERKVSVAWIIRDAAEKYVSERYPLFEANSKIEKPHA
ncbi:CopG family transcriptional regulator [Burkholderia sp. IT-111MI5]|uniref:ribbon-helix-helix domain-containing protein n=1 Tax=Burkholderia sp. IT-111MI5 TaxID=3026439 RepID=UPI0039DF4C38